MSGPGHHHGLLPKKVLNCCAFSEDPVSKFAAQLTLRRVGRRRRKVLLFNLEDDEWTSLPP